jgi:nitrite reductase/ring-hydroxylating ferredoxin subunit
MADFLEVASLEQIPPGGSLVVTVADKDVALFNVDGQIYAIDDACVHQGASLGSGKIEGKIVTCRAHGLKFDVTTGLVSGVPDFGVASHAVLVADGKIAVAVSNG